MSNAGVDAGQSAKVWNSTLNQLVNEIWYASNTPGAEGLPQHHGCFVLTDPEFNASIQQPGLPAYLASLPPQAQAFVVALPPNVQQMIADSAEAGQPI